MITIRPSSVRTFFENPSEWYKRYITGEDKFDGNTSTLLGSVIHKFAETYYTLESFNVDEILKDCPEGTDIDLINKQYPFMCDALEAKYLSKNKAPDLIEHFMKLKTDNEFIVQGTCDAYSDGILIDYKTSKQAKTKIDDYIQQLNIYAYMLHCEGKNVHTLRVVNVIQPTSKTEARINILETEADINQGKYLVEFMMNKARLAMNNPDMAKYIFTENPYSFMSGFNVQTKVVSFDSISTKEH